MVNPQIRAFFGLLGAGVLAAALVGTLLFILPPPVPHGEVRATGVVVRLTNDAHTLTVGEQPSPVPAGSYQVYALFGDDAVVASTLDLEAGEQIAIRCEPSIRRCTLHREP